MMKEIEDACLGDAELLKFVRKKLDNLSFTAPELAMWKTGMHLIEAYRLGQLSMAKPGTIYND